MEMNVAELEKESRSLREELRVLTERRSRLIARVEELDLLFLLLDRLEKKGKGEALSGQERQLVRQLLHAGGESRGVGPGRGVRHQRGVDVGRFVPPSERVASSPETSAEDDEDDSKRIQSTEMVANLVQSSAEPLTRDQIFELFDLVYGFPENWKNPRNSVSMAIKRAVGRELIEEHGDRYRAVSAKGVVTS